jgi:hypothetical protein
VKVDVWVKAGVRVNTGVGEGSSVWVGEGFKVAVGEGSTVRVGNGTGDRVGLGLIDVVGEGVRVWAGVEVAGLVIEGTSEGCRVGV